MCRKKQYLGLQFMEGVIFKTQAQFVVFLDALLHQGPGGVQPPVRFVSL